MSYGSSVMTLEGRKVQREMLEGSEELRSYGRVTLQEVEHIGLGSCPRVVHRWKRADESKMQETRLTRVCSTGPEVHRRVFGFPEASGQAAYSR